MMPKAGMILEYINAALEHAQCEIIEDTEPYYGEVPDLPGALQPGRHSRSAGETSLAASMNA